MKRKIVKQALAINVILLGIVSFLNDVSSEMISPILPLFITALGGTGIIVGLVGGLRDSITSILKVIFGFFSDKTGKRKVFVFSGYFTSSIFKLLLSFSKTWQHILTFSSLERIGKGIRTAPRDAIISESMSKEKGKGFGIHRTLDTSGAIVGSILALVLFWAFGLNFNSIILISALLAFSSLIPLYWVRERKRKRQVITFSVGIKKLPKPLKNFLLIFSIFTFSKISYMFFILKIQQFFPKNLSVIGPLSSYILFNIFYAIFAVPFGILSDKIGRKKVLGLGYFLFSLVSFGFAFFKSFYQLLTLIMLYGITYAILDGNQRAFVSDLSPKKLRGTALGAFHSLAGLISLPSNLIAGILWEISPSITFLWASILSIISAIGLFVWAANQKINLFSP